MQPHPADLCCVALRPTAPLDSQAPRYHWEKVGPRDDGDRTEAQDALGAMPCVDSTQAVCGSFENTVALTPPSGLKLL